MRTREKVLLSLLLVGVLGSVAGLGVFGAFSSTTSNPNNDFSTGTVTLADNDSNATLYSVTNQKPGDSVTKCINVTYTGSLASDVRMYTTSSIGTVGQYLDLTITADTGGSGSFPSCSGFTADPGGPVYSGTLANFATTRNSYATGLPTLPTGGTSWLTNDNVVYQFALQLQSSAPDTAQGLSTGTHAFTWEARNQ